MNSFVHHNFALKSLSFAVLATNALGGILLTNTAQAHTAINYGIVSCIQQEKREHPSCFFGESITGYYDMGGTNSNATWYISPTDFRASIGYGSWAGAKKAFAAGAASIASGENAVAIGAGSQATAYNSIAIGTGNIVSGEASGAIGDPSIISGSNSYSIGNNNAISSNTDNAIALGGQNNLGGLAARRVNGVIDTSAGIVDMASANRTMVVGFKNNVFNANDSAVVGNYNTVTANNTTVVGNNITADTENSVILGNESSGSETATIETFGNIRNVLYYGDFTGKPITDGHYVSIGSKGSERQIKNVAAGKVSNDSTDAINGSQLYVTNKILENVGESVKNVIGGSTTITPEGLIQGTNIANTGQTTVHNAIIAARTTVSSNDGSVNITPTEASGKLNYDVSVNVDNDTIKIVNGKLTATAQDTNTLTEIVAGNNIQVSGGDVVNGIKTYTIETKKEVTFDSVQVGDISVKPTGINAGNKPIAGVADGNIAANSTDAVNGGQLFKALNNINTNINSAKTEVKAGTNVASVGSATTTNGTIYTVNANGTSVSAGSSTVTVKQGTKNPTTNVTDYAIDLSNNTKADINKGVDAHNTVTTKGLTFHGDNGATTEQKLGSTVNVKGDKNITTSASGNTINVKLNDHLSLTQVTTGNTVINNNGIQVGNNISLTNNGLNNGGNRIVNVANGVEDSDAVNVSQLKGTETAIHNRIGNLDKNLRAGVAGALAAANLYHATDPGKSMISAGVGSYDGQSAVALGYSRLSDNGKVGVKFSVNSNSRGKTGAAASVGYQW